MISQGIGRGLIQTFGPMGQSQISKGKPIKLSTTLFVFYAQSSKVGEGSYFLGMGKVWRSKFEFGKSPIFGKVVFSLLGK